MDGHGRRDPAVDFEERLDRPDRNAAQPAGMRTLAEDGWRLVAMGITTVEEVLSVTTAKEVERYDQESRGRANRRRALRWPAH